MFESIIERYKKMTPQSNRLYHRAKQVFLDHGTRSVFKYDPYPIYVKEGNGSKIYDYDGNSYIDFCFNFTSLIVGHNHPSITQAVREILERGPPSGGPVEEEVMLAEEITNRIPCGEITRFSPSGTEAGMNVIRLARAYTQKKKIIKFEGCYHGTSDSLYISFLPQKLSTDLSCPVSQSDSNGILSEVVDNVITVPYNDVVVLEQKIKSNKEHLAAVIVEPIMPRSGVGGGLILPKNNFLQSLREITEENDVLLIFDEVITGFRLSKGGAQDYYNVVPDISMLGKVIGGGYPIGAVTGKREIMELAAGSSHAKTARSKVPISGTFSGHPVAAAAGLATLNELTPKVYDDFKKKTDTITIGLKKILTDLGIKAHVTGINSLFSILFTDKEEIVNYRDTLSSESSIFRYFTLDLLTKGIYWAPNHFSNFSIVTTDDDIQKAITAFSETLKLLKPNIRKISPNLIL